MTSWSSLNAQNVINRKRNVKENIIVKCSGERIMKEVVIIGIESYFFLHFTDMKCLNYICKPKPN